MVLMQQNNVVLNVGFVRTVFGTVLPPVMIWERNFCKLLPTLFASEIPKCITMVLFSVTSIYKRSWSVAFEKSFSALTWKHAPVEKLVNRDYTFPFSPKRRPVARALCFDISDGPAEVASVFSSPALTRSGRKRKCATPTVDTGLRRCTRSAAKSNG
jgi:hypothetical protein